MLLQIHLGAMCVVMVSVHSHKIRHLIKSITYKHIHSYIYSTHLCSAYVVYRHLPFVYTIPKLCKCIHTTLVSCQAGIMSQGITIETIKTHCFT